MATIDWATILEALIAGLTDLKGAVASTPASTSGPTITASAFASLPAAARDQLILANVKIIPDTVSSQGKNP